MKKKEISLKEIQSKYKSRLLIVTTIKYYDYKKNVID